MGESEKTQLRIIYSSRAVADFSEEDARALLEISRRKNQFFGITGALFYGSSTFLQILEGQKLDVNNLIELIRQDPRHTDFEVLVREEIEHRYFGQWAMAYSVLNDENVKKLGGTFNVHNVSDFVSYIKRPDSYLGPIFRSVIDHMIS